MHTIIIGNGILGLTTAFRLARRAGAQDRITLIGRKSRPGSATLAAAAMLNSFAELEKGSLDDELDRFRFELSQRAAKMWPKFALELGDATGAGQPDKRRDDADAECVNMGTYVINNTATDDLDDENFDAILQALRDFNEPHSLVDPAGIPNYLPEPRHRATRAVYIDNEGWFNPRLVIEQLDAAMTRFAQVRVVDDAVERLEGDAAGIKAVVTEGGERLEADTFVLANGSMAGALLDKSKLGLSMQRIFHGVGVSIEIRSPDYPHTKCIRTPNRGLACGVYTVPYFHSPEGRNDHLIIGASNFVSADPQPHGRLTSVEHIMRSAIEQVNFNFYRAELIRVNVGWRPTSQDTYPLIGKTSIDNLIVVTGTKRDGFHLSPLISEQVVAMVYGEDLDERLSWFAPERAPIRALSREAAIRKTVRHQMNAAYQHGFTPSTSRMPDQIRKMYRDDLERLHDEVGAVDWGIPPEMVDMYRYGHAKP